MDRCPRCWTRLLFAGIIAKDWTRWLECPECGLYVATNATGAIKYTGNAIPDIKVFREQSR